MTFKVLERKSKKACTSAFVTRGLRACQSTPIAGPGAGNRVQPPRIQVFARLDGATRTNVRWGFVRGA